MIVKPTSDDQFRYVLALFSRYRSIMDIEKSCRAAFAAEFGGALSFTRCSDPRAFFELPLGVPIGAAARVYRRLGGVLTHADASFQKIFFRDNAKKLGSHSDMTFLTQLHSTELGKGGCAYYANKPEIALADARAFTEDCQAHFNLHAPGRFFPHVVNYETETGRVYIDDPVKNRWVSFGDLVADNGTSLVGDTFPHLSAVGRERLAVLARRHRKFLASEQRAEINRENLSCIVVSGWAEFALGSPFVFPNDPRCNSLETTVRIATRLALHNVLSQRSEPFRRILLMTATPFRGHNEHGLSRSAAVLQSKRVIEWQKRHVEDLVAREHWHLFDFIPTIIDMERLELIRLDSPEPKTVPASAVGWVPGS